MTTYKVYGVKGNQIVSGKTWKEAKKKVTVGKVLQVDTLDDEHTSNYGEFKTFWR